jgi:tRNA-dihydrouridine synthase
MNNDIPDKVKPVKYCLAPMEGITGHIFRKAIHDHFGKGIDKYYSPFLVVHEKVVLSGKELRDVLPSNNEGMTLVPQILTNDAEGFIRTADYLTELGYNEVNLNLGCPSKTVAGKGRGSGFLSDTDGLDRFLYRIYEKCRCGISVKTRIGTSDPGEFEELMDIYNKYPVKELIIHPRVRYEYYKGHPHRDVFYKYSEQSLNPVCYNGDVTSRDDIDELMAGTGNRLEAVMIGRGMLIDPSLIRTLNGEKGYTGDELRAFLNRLIGDYKAELSGDRQVLMKLKELWGYLGRSFLGKEKVLKQLLKCGSLMELKLLQEQMLKDMD